MGHELIPGPLADGATVVVREYQPDAPAGLVGDWLDARGISWTISRPADEPSIDGAAAVIALGSSMSAYWREPAWIDAEADCLGRSVDAGARVLGICFGAQILARALGGQVARADVPEIGWVRPLSDLPELSGPYLTWHSDAITLPPGARSLAVTPHALQAYTLGRATGLQFHPEATPRIWQDWCDDDPDAVTRQVANPELLQAEIRGSVPASRERAFALLDWWWDRN